MILCADFETSSEQMFLKDKRAKVYLWGIKSLDNEKLGDPCFNNLTYGTSISSFFSFISDLPDCTIYFHNLSHDGEFIIWYLLQSGYKSVMKEDDDLEEYEFNSLITDSNKYYSIVVKTHNNKITFKCSFRLIPLSIKALGSIVGVEKLDDSFDYDDIKTYFKASDIPLSDLKYIHNDVEIARLMLIKAFEIGIDKLTLAASSYSHWKSLNIQFEKNLPELDESTQKIVDESYKGGITYVNPDYAGKEVENCVSYDVNSLYPSVMLDNPMPYGEPEHVNNTEKKNRLYLRQIYVVYAEVREGYHPFIGMRSGFGISSYKYPMNFSCKFISLWDKEFELFTKYYEAEYSVITTLAFKKKSHVFDSYFETWKNIKETTTNEAEKKLAKLMMNALYGKFGSSKIKRSKYIDGIRDGKLHETLVSKEVKAYYRPIASYITSVARCVLIEAIELCKERFIYCDTDSIYLRGLGSPPIKIDNRKLGYWGFEGNINTFKALKAKCYLKQNGSQIESRIAGLPKKAQKLVSFDNLCDGTIIERSKLARKRVCGGVVLMPTDFTIHI